MKELQFFSVWWPRLCMRSVLCIAGVGACQAAAAEPTFSTCQISIGQVVFCGAPYTGQAVLAGMQGQVRRCDVSVGRPVFCSGPYSGQAVLPTHQQEGYASCQVSIGKAVFCQGPYSGQIVAADPGSRKH